ncbi:glutathione S-transferase family protein [Enterovibrio sp. ZSDZ35]|uniref:Glutathione S-transferase family protein n=1 Tax=Enterovibrio qingdaonensis TaxID=2899818 RepID=A0ABT5QH67_9GAMM|nr:glutathione S-transferase family protein [Enterovibrio sp. ZSDZ35]MDD1780332.1 glutathione S-transferase family protein [Enterovibrio sp. ZSDZ35]
MKLIIANKNYSTWSLRGWLALRAFDVDFDEVELPLFTEEFYAEIAKYSDAAKVPVLVDGDIAVWDSLAICEYVNDAYLSGRAWPESLANRAKARAISAEMHSGFMALRNEMPMNIRGRRKVSLSQDCLNDIARIDDIWASQMKEFGDKGGWLFGDYSIADVMYAPVILRFITYGVTLSAEAQRYANHALQSAALQQWIEESKKDTSIVSEDEAGVEVA